jgi:hypothetical protein
MQDTDNIGNMSVYDLTNTPGLGVKGVLEILAVISTIKGRQIIANPSEKYTVSRKLRRACLELSKKRWSSKLHAHDPRLGDYLLSIGGGANNPTAKEIAEALKDTPLPGTEAKIKYREINRLVNKASQLSKLTLKTELSQIIDSIEPNQRTRQIVVARLGADGGDPQTLDKVGKSGGITRERVRQIEAKCLSKIQQRSPIWTPVLDKTLSLVARFTPIKEKDLQKLLKDQGLIWGDFSIESLIKIAEIFEKNVDFVYDKEHGFVSHTRFIEHVPEVTKTASSLVTHWGATTVDELRQELVSRGVDIDSNQIYSALEYRDDLVWLNKKDGWFWLKDAPKNRVLNYVQKIMSVAGSIDLGELRNGTGRWHRVYGYRLPKKILLALCITSGLYSYSDEKLIGGDNLPDWRSVLASGEKTIVEILFDNGYIMRRADLEEKATEAGLNRTSFYIYLGYSPVLARYAPGVYGLRGAPVTAAQIESLIPPRQRTSKIFRDNGWTEKGNLWMAYKISRASSISGVVGVPSNLAKFIRGSFRLHTESNQPIGTLTIRNSNMWGLSPFFRKWGVEAGDYIVIEFDTKSESAIITTGDEEVITRYQEQAQLPTSDTSILQNS